MQFGITPAKLVTSVGVRRLPSLLEIITLKCVLEALFVRLRRFYRSMTTARWNVASSAVSMAIGTYGASVCDVTLTLKTEQWICGGMVRGKIERADPTKCLGCLKSTFGHW